RADEALEAARTAIQRFPDDASAYVDAAVAWQAKGQITNAIPLARRGIELAPDNLRGYRILANIWSAQNEVEETAAVCRDALRVLPEHAELHLKLGKALAVLANQPLATTNPVPHEARLQLQLPARLSLD